MRTLTVSDIGAFSNRLYAMKNPRQRRAFLDSMHARVAREDVVFESDRSRSWFADIEARYGLKSHAILTEYKPMLLAALETARTTLRSGKLIEVIDLLKGRASRQLLKPLVAALEDSNQLVREIVVKALVTIGSKAALNPLIKVATNPDEDSYTRGVAAIGLGKIGGDRAVETLLTLVDRETDELFLQFLADALGRTKDQTAIPVLTRLLRESESYYVRRACACCLGELRSSEAAEALKTALKEGKDFDLTKKSADALVKYGEAIAFEPLKEALKHKNPEFRDMIVESLAKLGKVVVPVLIETLSKDSSPTVRAKAAYSLRQINDERALEALLFALKDPDFNVRSNAEGALKELSILPSFSEESEAILVKALLGDSVSEIKLQAILFLEKIASGLVVALIKAIDDNDSNVRNQVIAALVRIRNPKSINALANALGDEKSTWHNAMRALVTIGGDAATDALLDFLRRTTRNSVQVSLIEALQQAINTCSLEKLVEVEAAVARMEASNLLAAINRRREPKDDDFVQKLIRLEVRTDEQGGYIVNK